MISEFLVYRTDQTIKDVLNDLQINREEYVDYHVQYFYVVDQEEKLVGVLRMHDMLFPTRGTKLDQIMLSSPLSVSDKASLRELEDFFEEHNLLGAPVVDDNGTAGWRGAAQCH